MHRTREKSITINAANTSELFLLRLRYKEGRLIDAGGNSPILLNNPEMSWVVYSGQVELFIVPLDRGEIAGARVHLMTVRVGQVIFGFDLEQINSQLGLLALGVGETKLIQVKTERLLKVSAEATFSKQVINMVEVWVMKLSAAVAPNTPPRQVKLVIKLVRDEEITLSRDMAAIARNQIIWVKNLMGRACFMGQPELALSLEIFMPLTKQTWLKSQGTCWLEAANLGADDKTPVQQADIWPGLVQFHQLILKFIFQEFQSYQQAEHERLDKKQLADQATINYALTSLATILEAKPASVLGVVDAQTHPLLAAVQLVGEALQIPIQAGHQTRQNIGHSFQLEGIAKASNIRTRQVALRGDWWHYDVQPLLAFIEPIKSEEANEQNPSFIPPKSGLTEGGPQPRNLTHSLHELAKTLTAPRPVAILPAQNQSGYEIVDPIAQTRTLLTPDAAELLAYFAYSFYRPLPNRALTLMDLARLGAFGLQRDLWTILATGGLIGLFALATPIAIGVLFESVIPNAEIGQLLQLTIALIIITLATTLLQLARSFAFLRIQSKADAAIQAAIWDRLLRLPTTFFRQYSAGDLAVRANGINTIKEYLTGSTMNALFSGVMAIFYLGLLCYYSLSLALVGVGLVMAAVIITLLVGVIKLNQQRQLIDVEGRISGMVFQFIGGIAKFRASGTENWVFATWAREFTQQRQLAFKAETAANGLVVFNSSYSILASLVIFLAFTYFNPRLTEDLSTGHFLAFYSAFGLLLAAALDLTNTVIGLLNIVPVYERLQPILQTLPEVTEGQLHPGELTGAIELSNVVFRYQANGPRILNGLSLQIKAGQFVAFVGPSGSGKSTILRLLLGFEQSEAGAVYYDGQDLKTLNIQAVRRQIGTVLQSGGLMPSTIFSNIVGSSPLTLDDAWKAARLAGLAEDIEQMPMGMHTTISEGATTFSGGQRQRLLIARAIVNNPHILLFDEATSALDNRTQAVVSQSLETFHVTRLVIAHRLSTVVNADVIFVIDKGEVVQQGTYQELVNQPGPFAELAKRQLA